MKGLSVLFEKKTLVTLSIVSILSWVVIQNFSGLPSEIEHSTTTNQYTANNHETSNSGSDDPADTGTPDSILELSMFKLASVDGALRADDDGELIVDRKLRQWIDFHLSAMGELSLDHIKILMNQKIDLLPRPARQQAQELLASYLSYKEALASYDNEFQQIGPTDHLDNLQQRHSWQKRLRREALSPETVEAFWQLDELVDDYALEELVITNSNISDEEKAYQLEKMEEALPEALKSFRRDLYIASNLEEQVVKSREEGESDESIRQLRIEQVGIEATERLEALDVKQNEWQKRLLAYDREVKTVNSIEGLTEQDKQARIKTYQESNFNEKEQLRLETAMSLLQE